MKSFVRKLLILIFAAALLVILNPGLTKHQDKIIAKFKQDNTLIGLLPADDLIRGVVTYHDFYLFSTCKILGIDETVSLGIAGFVIVFANMDVAKNLDKLQKNVN